MTDLSMFAIILIAISPAVGSFLNVLIDRLPRGEDVMFRPSACRSCGTRLGLVDLIPILSYAMHRGGCRHCGAAIPAWHLYVEIAATGLAVLSVLSGGSNGTIVLTVLFWWILLALAVTDLIWFRLPDLLTAALFAVGLAIGVLDPFRLPVDVVLAAAAGAGSFLVVRVVYARIRHREGLGLGDVKLMAGIGAWAGLLALPGLVLLAALLALAGVLAGSLIAGERMSKDQRLPFGAALAAATFLSWVFVPAQF
jgi:leader peptidase (prepilin peptidase) / N-methyltransferase